MSDPAIRAALPAGGIYVNGGGIQSPQFLAAAVEAVAHD